MKWAALLLTFTIGCGGTGLSGGAPGSTNTTRDLGGNEHHATTDLALAVVRDLSPPPPGNLTVGSQCQANNDCRSDFCGSANVCLCNKPDKGYRCFGDDDCCAGGFCYQNACVSSAPFCAALNTSCAGNQTCCLGQCNASSGSGVCTCVAGGGECSSNKDCCAGGCAPPGINGGASRCNQVGTGEHCVNNDDCVSFSCVGGVCK
jgi:hypothetical protein